MNFKKAIVIFGKGASGLSSLAQVIASRFGETKVFNGSCHAQEVDSYEAPDFISAHCSAETKAIIITDCPKDFFYGYFFNFITRGVQIHQQGQEALTILPLLIFVSEYRPNDSSHSFMGRFELIDMEQSNPNLAQSENLAVPQ